MEAFVPIPKRKPDLIGSISTKEIFTKGSRLNAV